ncbi:hypothetical protein J6590_077283 [Homalodisca vitripennis]|nr:hypothetical protein J6590_077283 [Homalodisca vitripennis]
MPPREDLKCKIGWRRITVAQIVRGVLDAMLDSGLAPFNNKWGAVSERGNLTRLYVTLEWRMIMQVAVHLRQWFYFNVLDIGVVLKPQIEENMQTVAQAFVARTGKSTRKASAEIEISRRSVQRMLKQFKFKPYRPSLLQALHEHDSDRRLEFCETIIAAIIRHVSN